MSNSNTTPTPAILNESESFRHVSTGGLEDLALHLVAGISGKLFLKELLGLTGMEVSINVMAPGQGMPISHSHRLNEELYVFLSGTGQFMVGDTVFEIGPGSCIRVAPAGVRCWRNIGAEPLHFLCIQAPLDGMNGQQREDGVGEGRPHWNKVKGEVIP